MSERDYFRHDFDGRRGGPFWLVNRTTWTMLLGLVAIHVLLFLLSMASREGWRAAQLALALDPRAVLERFYVWQLVTGALLHGSPWHLFWNCWALFIFGRMVEDRLGSRRYLVFCLGSSLAASLLYVGWSLLEGAVYPMLGFSGVVMGLVVICAFWYPSLPFLFGIPLWVLAVVYVAIDLMSAMGSDQSIAHTAHLGGALYGFLYYQFGNRFAAFGEFFERSALRRKRRKERRREIADDELRAEVDRILDKVNREGIHALTHDERRFLKDASARLKR